MKKKLGKVSAKKHINKRLSKKSELALPLEGLNLSSTSSSKSDEAIDQSLFGGFDFTNPSSAKIEPIATEVAEKPKVADNTENAQKALA